MRLGLSGYFQAVKRAKTCYLKSGTGSHDGVNEITSHFLTSLGSHTNTV